MNNMTTLVSVLETLRKHKKDNEFTMSENKFTVGNQKTYSPDELTIIKTYRFEGDSNPGDSSILYLIEANDGLIGYCIDAYGAFSNQPPAFTEFIKKVKVEDRHEQILFTNNNESISGNS